MERKGSQNTAHLQEDTDIEKQLILNSWISLLSIEKQLFIQLLYF